MDFILSIWLTDVPPLTAGFCRLILVCSVIDATTGVLNTAITATGKIRGYQIGIALSFFLDFIIAFILLFFEVNPILVFASRLLTRGLINMFIGLYHVQNKVRYKISYFMKGVLLPVIVSTLITFPFCLFMMKLYTGWQLLIITSIWSIISVSGCVWFVIFSKDDRKRVKLLLIEKGYGF